MANPAAVACSGALVARPGGMPGLRPEALATITALVPTRLQALTAMPVTPATA